MSKSTHGLFMIRDNVADEFAPVFQAPNKAVAWRQFVDLLKKAVNPKDYTLFQVGFVNRDTGEVSGCVMFEIDEFISDEEVVK